MKNRNVQESSLVPVEPVSLVPREALQLDGVSAPIHILDQLHQKGARVAASSYGEHGVLRVWLRSISTSVDGRPASESEAHAREVELSRRRSRELEAAISETGRQLSTVEATAIPGGGGPVSPEALARIRKEIQDLRAEKALASGRRSQRAQLVFVVKSVIMVLLTAYLYFFYVNAGYAAFSKNLGEAAAMAVGSGDVSVLFDSLFAPGVFLTAIREGNALLLLFPFVFIAFAVAMHQALESGRSGVWRATGLALFTMGIDVLVAYLITSNSHNIRVLTGLAEGDYHFRDAVGDPRFWVVIVLGIVVAVLWGLIYGSWVAGLSSNNEGGLDEVIRIKESEIDRRLAEHVRLRKELEDRIEGTQRRLAEESKRFSDLEEKGRVSVLPWSEIERRCLAFLNGWVSAVSALANLEFPVSNRSGRPIVEDAQRVGLETIESIRNTMPEWVN